MLSQHQSSRFGKLAIAAFVALPIAAPAQLIRGTIVETVGEIPVPGAIVTLVQPPGKVVRTTLSNEAGSFSFRAERGGEHVIEVKRIGVRPTRTLPFSVRIGETVAMRITVASLPARQPPVMVNAKARCAPLPEDGAVLSALWEDARAALTSAYLARQNRLVSTTILHYVRETEPNTSRVLRYEEHTRAASADNPFTSVDAGRLSREGYVVTDSLRDTWYRAPDAEVLLSDTFLQNHCFRLVQPTQADAGLIGLGFEPMRKGLSADVEGTLWLESATRELKTLEFSYTGVSRVARNARAGGRLDFTKTPYGVWIVRRWEVRMPVVRMVETRTPIGGIVQARQSEVLQAIRQEGGEVIGDHAADFRKGTESSGAVIGFVFDSTRHIPLGKALVTVAGTAISTTSDHSGRFQLDSLPAGTWTLVIRHARLDSLGIAVLSQDVTVVNAVVTSSKVAIPSRAVVARTLCPHDPLNPHSGIVRGTVRDASGAPVVAALLELSWLTHHRAGSDPGDVNAHTTRITAATDEHGWFALCGIRAEQEVQLSGRKGSLRSKRLKFRIAPREIRIRDLTLQD